MSRTDARPGLGLVTRRDLSRAARSAPRILSSTARGRGERFERPIDPLATCKTRRDGASRSDRMQDVPAHAPALPMRHDPVGGRPWISRRRPQPDLGRCRRIAPALARVASPRGFGWSASAAPSDVGVEGSSGAAHAAVARLMSKRGPEWGAVVDDTATDMSDPPIDHPVLARAHADHIGTPARRRFRPDPRDPRPGIQLGARDDRADAGGVPARLATDAAEGGTTILVTNRTAPERT